VYHSTKLSKAFEARSDVNLKQISRRLRESQNTTTMWLLNLRTSPFKLQSFKPDDTPPYVILSHTWSVKNAEEIKFEDVTNSGYKYERKKAWIKKVRGFCDKVQKHKYRFVWIDTCCIDKSSSAELGEAITSMYKWYRSAEVCYVHLADVVKKDDQPISEQLILANGKAPVWFTRGWTLQELLAPHRVIFYDKNWQRLGSRIELAGAIHTLTKIPKSALTGNNPRKFSVTDRMSWARGRETTIDEDIVYCLVGLFGVSIPVLYGEGRKNAMRHLKAEIGANRMDDPSSEHAVTSAYLRDRSPHNLSGSRSSATPAETFLNLALVGGVLYGAYLVISYGAHLIISYLKTPRQDV
jgi:Heterokaryon incompatibility protein (HET)